MKSIGYFLFGTGTGMLIAGIIVEGHMFDIVLLIMGLFFLVAGVLAANVHYSKKVNQKTQHTSTNK